MKSSSWISPSLTFHSGRLHLSVWHALWSNSFNRRCLNPAFSIPNARPPAPAKSSTDVYSCSGMVSNSLSQVVSMADISGKFVSLSMEKNRLPDESVSQSIFPLFIQASIVARETPRSADRLLMDIFLGISLSFCGGFKSFVCRKC